MITVRLTAIGDSVGIVLPPQVLERLGVAESGVRYLVDTLNGVELTAFNPNADDQATIPEHVMRSDREVLKRLRNSNKTLPIGSSR